MVFKTHRIRDTDFRPVLFRHSSLIPLSYSFSTLSVALPIQQAGAGFTIGHCNIGCSIRSPDGAECPGKRLHDLLPSDWLLPFSGDRIRAVIPFATSTAFKMVPE